MTDLEITNLCAEAMGIEMCELHSHYWPHYFDSDIGEWGADVKYDPIHDDMQAVALLKKFPGAAMMALIAKGKFDRRAICESTAARQKAKDVIQA